MLLDRGFYSPIIEVITSLYGTKFRYKSPYKGEILSIDLTWFNKFSDKALKHVFTAVAKCAKSYLMAMKTAYLLSANTMLIDRRVDVSKLALIIDAFLRSLVECQNLQRALKASAI